eukprot:1121135-Pleurochrysis_carterae.AAC.2
MLSSLDPSLFELRPSEYQLKLLPCYEPSHLPGAVDETGKTWLLTMWSRSAAPQALKTQRLLAPQKHSHALAKLAVNTFRQQSYERLSQKRHQRPATA